MYNYPNSDVRQALIVLDACTFNPFKPFKTTKPRLKAKIQRQLNDQPKILQLLSKLQGGQRFVVHKCIAVAAQSWSHNDDSHVLAEIEKIAAENPGCIVIFVTRDQGFSYSADWRSYQSRVYIFVLPHVFFSKSIDQFSRLDMMYIISIDVTTFLTNGRVTYSQIYMPEL
ncbi:MAG: hypothetical protein Q8P77_02920 [Candidatus Veblenbacteria bacterium]|nr:hypothetical protein [Candidatus Veblenbacteria bacterium]